MQIVCIMNGSKVAEFFYSFFYLFINEHTFIEFVATMYNAMTYCVDFIKTFDCSNFRIGEKRKHETYTFFMVLHIVHDFFLTAIGHCNFYKRVIKPDTFCATLTDYAFVLHIEQFVLDRRTSAI